MYSTHDHDLVSSPIKCYHRTQPKEGQTSNAMSKRGIRVQQTPAMVQHHNAKSLRTQCHNSRQQRGKETAHVRHVAHINAAETAEAGSSER
eukprot:4099853-Amphidinium_carterae.1